MRCTNAQQLIALMPSGDVSADEARRAADHIAQCASCRRLAEAEPLALASLRTPPPLRAADYAAVRARVLAGLAPDRRRLPFSMPFRLAAAAAVLAAIAGIGVFMTTPEFVEVPPNAALVEQPRTPAVPVDPPAALAEAIEPALAEAIEPAIPPKPAPLAPASPAPPPSPSEPATALAALDQAEQLRIQIQTGDPDVRIIWIVNPTLELEPTFLEEES